MGFALEAPKAKPKAPPPTAPKAGDNFNFSHCLRCGCEWKAPEPYNGKCARCNQNVADGHLPQAIPTQIQETQSASPLVTKKRWETVSTAASTAAAASVAGYPAKASSGSTLGCKSCQATRNDPTTFAQTRAMPTTRDLLCVALGCSFHAQRHP